MEWGIFAPSMISARLTDRVTPTGTRVSAHTGKATRGIRRSFELLVLTLRYLQIHTHFFFFRAPGETYLFSSFYLQKAEL